MAVCFLGADCSVAVVAFGGAFGWVFVVVLVVVFAVAFAGVFAGALALGVAVLGTEAFGTFGVVAFVAGALGIAVLTFLAAVPSSSFAFLFVPALVSAFATPFFASRSFLVHSFLSFISILPTLSGTFNPPALTASKSRMRATDFVFEGEAHNELTGPEPVRRVVLVVARGEVFFELGGRGTTMTVLA